jgi:regulator of protease activity HflC (stomatin/prohibitin superfamily)
LPKILLLLFFFFLSTLLLHIFTKNVLVDIDVSFNFQVVDAHKFVMLMGAGRFQELLRVETEEAIRTLVYTRKILTVRDTTTEDHHTAAIQSALNRSVNAYGVQITNIRIVNVTLPQKLQDELTEQTNIVADLITMEKEHQRDLEVRK